MSVAFTLFAHRGASAFAPENTLAAIGQAARRGAEWVEVDVQLTADGALVVIHDHQVDRTTDGSGSVQEKTLGELQALDAGSWFDPRFAGEQIPTLEQVLVLCERFGLRINVELKHAADQARATAEALARTLEGVPADRLLISSFNGDALLRFRERQPLIRVGALFEALPGDWFRLADDMEAYSVHLSHRRLTVEQAAQVRATERKLFVYTVNDERLLARLISWRVDGVFTDRPGELSSPDRSISSTAC
ncbi:MAG: glycerophosphodiester phosphodiesterase family protein [Geminicoccaceae bacterium]